MYHQSGAAGLPKGKLSAGCSAHCAAGCALLGAAVLAVGMAGQVQTRIGGHEGYTFVPELGGWIGDQPKSWQPKRN